MLSMVKLSPVIRNFNRSAMTISMTLPFIRVYILCVATLPMGRSASYETNHTLKQTYYLKVIGYSGKE